MKLKLNPIAQLTLLLSIYSLAAILVNLHSFTKTILHLLATVGFSIVLFYIFKFITKKAKNLYNTVISALIIFLICHHFLDFKEIIYPLLATFIAVFSKFFLQPKGLPVINPAVLGLLLTYLISKILPGMDEAFISWWGTAYKYSFTISDKIYQIPIALILIAGWIMFQLKTWRKFPVLVTFLLANAVVFFLRSIWTTDFQSILTTLKFTYTDASIYFFSAIMLIEPKTSPILKKDQIFYAIVAVIIYNILAHFHIAQFELWAITGANLYWYGKKFWMQRTAQKLQQPLQP